MIIVAGALAVEPSERDGYLEQSTDAVVAARQAPGRRDFALSPDLLDDGRINVFELWESEEDLQHFRGSGPGGDQLASLLEINVREFQVTPLTR